MKNILPEFENHSQRKLNQYEAHVDVEKLFSSIDPIINKKKKRRLGFWLFFPSLLIGSGLLYWHNINQNNSSSEFNKKSIFIESAYSDLQNQNRSSISNHNDNGVQKNIENKLSNKSTTTDQHNNIQFISQSQNISSIKQSTQTPSSKESIKITKWNKRQNINKIVSIENNIPTSFIEKNEQTTVQQNINSTIATKQNNNPISISGFYNPTTDDERANFEIITPLLSTKDYTLLPKINFNKGANCYSFNSNSKFYLDISASYIFAIKQLSATSVMYANYLDLLQKNEKTLEGFGAELAGLYFPQKNYYFRLGFGYNRVTEQYKHFQDGTKVDTVWGLKNIYIDPNGDSIIVYGNIPKITHYTQIFELYSYYHNFNIPLSIGYQIINGNWAIRPEIGAVLQFGKFQRGTSVDQNSTIYALQSKSDLMRHAPQLNFRFNCAVDYKIGNNASIYFSPRLYILPNHFSNTKNPIDRNYYQMDFALGLLRKF